MSGTEMLAEAATGADLDLARSAVYRLLSQVFAYPTPEAVRQLREQDLPLARAVAAPLPGDVRSALDEVAVAFRGVRTSRLEADYRDTFSHVHSADCPPYETDFTSREVFRQTNELADLAGFYRAFGLDEVAERPDHLSVETEFMHLLTYKEAWAEAQGDDEGAEICRRAQERFLADHLAKWAPNFARRLQASAQGAYRTPGPLLLAFVRAEAERFGLGVGTGVAPFLEGPADDAGLCEVGP